MKSEPVKTVDEAGWVAALAGPETQVETSMCGLPFRFLPWRDWDTKPKRISEHMLYFVVAGYFHSQVEGRRFVLRAGELCWVNPGVNFRFHSDPATQTEVRRFRLKVRQGRQPLRLKWDCRVFQGAAESMEWARSLVGEPLPRGRFAAQRLAHLAALFSISVFDAERAERRAAVLPPGVCRRISSYVLDHVEERITPAALARLAGLSPDYFTRMFRRTYGLPPREWLLQQRLRHAAGLLAEDTWRISEISARLGYPDPYLFSRQFKQEFGESPRAWRKRQAGFSPAAAV